MSTERAKRKPLYVVTLLVEASQLPTVEKAARAVWGDGVRSVRKNDPSRSRADRLSDVQSSIESACSDIDELKDELQEWHDNLPENLQSSQKAEDIQEAIDALEQIKDELDGVDFSNVSFPSMM